MALDQRALLEHSAARRSSSATFTRYIARSLLEAGGLRPAQHLNREEPITHTLSRLRGGVAPRPLKLRRAPRSCSLGSGSEESAADRPSIEVADPVDPSARCVQAIDRADR